MPGDRDSSNVRERISQQGKLIDLRGHHAAEQALDALLVAGERDPDYENLLAEAIALTPHILAAIVRRLDSSRPSGFPIMGQLVALYPFRVQAAQTLLRAASDRRNSDNRRMGAMLLLNQFLGVPPSEDFLSSLRNPALTAADSLIGVLNDCAGRPDMLLGYFRALSALPLEMLYAMLNTLADAPGSAAVAALRLLALQPDPDLMRAAIEALISRSDFEALKALAALEPNLPPEPAHAVSRHLHKLRLSGYSANLLKVAGNECRALLSPIDGRGRRMLWLLVPSANFRLGNKRSTSRNPQSAIGYIALLLRDTIGILDALGASSHETDAFPRSSPVGALHTLHTPLPGESLGLAPYNEAAWRLEVPFVYGLRILRAAVQENWLSGTPLPLEYQMLFDTVWHYSAGLDADADYQEKIPDIEDPAENENDLLCNPLFDSWYLESGAVYLAAQELLAQDVGLPVQMTDQSWRALLPMVIKLARSELSLDTRRCYSKRLKSMAQWLTFAGQEEEARLAVSAAKTMLSSPPEANLFVLSLVQKGMLMALANLMSADELSI